MKAAPARICGGPRWFMLATPSATAEAHTAASQDRKVSPPLKPIAMGSSNACMPTKCMDQMPVPITVEPAIHQMEPTSRRELCMRRARSRVT